MVALPGISCYKELVTRIKSHERNVLQLTQDLRNFIHNNQDPKHSANFASKEVDDFDALLRIIDIHFHHCVIILLVLKTLKILSRKKENRTNLSPMLVDAVQRIIATYNADSQICFEYANVILNLCYERENVPKIISRGCVSHLVRLLSSDHTTDFKLLAAVVGAIQSICFQKEGKEFIRQSGALNQIVEFLGCSDATVRSRAVGALHNLSSELQVVIELRDCLAIPSLVSLLKDANVSIAASAAGCIQNFSRDEKCRCKIREYGAVMPLADMLFINYLPAQTCAAGALLNVCKLMWSVFVIKIANGMDRYWDLCWDKKFPTMHNVKA
jgi:hypothetical protein